MGGSTSPGRLSPSSPSKSSSAAESKLLSRSSSEISMLGMSGEVRLQKDKRQSESRQQMN